MAAAIRAKFPWWDLFHGWWGRLPNYNPVGVFSSADASSADRFDALLAPKASTVAPDADAPGSPAWEMVEDDDDDELENDLGGGFEDLGPPALESMQNGVAEARFLFFWAGYWY